MPSDFPKIDFKCHHNDTSRRAVLINTSRHPYRFPLPLFSQNCAPKSELLELHPKILSILTKTRKTKTDRLPNHGPFSPSVLLTLGLIFRGQETESIMTSHKTDRIDLHSPSSKPYPFTVMPTPNFNEGYFWYSTYFEIILQVSYYPFW